jgi:hypothetical protein
MRARIAFAAFALSAFAVTVRGQESPGPASRARSEILVLGTYHMANPGRDIFNTQVDDVLSQKRQGEMAQLVAVLERFRPTKVAVEYPAGDERLAKRYTDYLAGKYDLSRNEIDQIGLRLAKVLGHKTVYAVDTDGEFPYLRLVKYAKATERAKELDALQAEIGEMVKAQGEFIASHTIFESLLYMNSDEKVAEATGYYFRQAEFGEPWDWAGADLVADWFRRNMRIYTNVTRLVESPNERVLVIYGAGHLGWLQFAFGSNPNLRLRKLSEFAR